MKYFFSFCRQYTGKIALAVLCSVSGLLLSLYPGKAKAQAVYELKGYMGVQGGESFNYDLELKDSAGSWLSGYAYTYKTPGKGVKTRLAARIDRKKKQLYIQEQAIVYNHGFQSRAVICLVEALLSYEQEGAVLKGKLITRTANNGRACSSGSISLIYPKQIHALFNAPASPASPDGGSKKPLASAPPKVDPTAKLHAYFARQKRLEAALKKEKAQQKAAPVASVIPVVQQVTEGQEGTYVWTSDEIIFTIWDGSDEDGDRIDVLYNGEKVLSNYTLKNQQKKIVFPMGSNEVNTISIVALNEGSRAPNTANILLQDGEQQYQVMAHNIIGKKAVLVFKKR